MVNLPCSPWYKFSTCTRGADHCAEARRGFDAYWTPLFGDGSFAAQLCEAGGGWVGNACQWGVGWKRVGIPQLGRVLNGGKLWKMMENGGKWWKMVENEVLYLFHGALCFLLLSN